MKNNDYLNQKNVPGAILAHYGSYFHDGDLIAIKKYKDEIVFEMESSEIEISDNIYSLPLSIYNTLYGKLHAKNIISIKNDNIEVKNLKIKYEYGEFLHCEFSDTRIYLIGQWRRFGVKTPRGNPVFDFEVLAKEIYWENTGNIKDPALWGKFLGIDE